jgi:hypothetical protein
MSILIIFGGFDKKMNAILAAKDATHTNRYVLCAQQAFIIIIMMACCVCLWCHNKNQSITIINNSDAMLAAAIATSPVGSLPPRALPAPLSAAYQQANTNATDDVNTPLQPSGGNTTSSSSSTGIEIDNTSAVSSSTPASLYPSMYPVALAVPTSSSSGTSAAPTRGSGLYAQLV